MSTLAAARADNFYYPRDWDPSKGNITQFQKNKRKGLTGEEAQSQSNVKMVNKIRFEMMFNVRCLQCKNSIGKGVRFNAHKKCIGQYLSTKIYEFTMNCHLCGNKLSIKTDPKGCDYIIGDGLEKRPEAISSDEIAAKQDPDRRQKLDTNAFYKLENANEDKLKADADIPRLEKLIELKEKDKDYFQWNSLLRKRMRDKKHEAIAEEEEQKKPRNFGLDLIKSLDDQDKTKVNDIRLFQSNNNYRKQKMEARDCIRQQSIFGSNIKKDEVISGVKKLPIDIKNEVEKRALEQAKLKKAKEQSQRSKVFKHLERMNKV